MIAEDRIQELLEELMEERRSPEDVCLDSPELLNEVRERWNHLRRVEDQVRLCFPSLVQQPDIVAAEWSDCPRLPSIEGYEVLNILGRGGMGVVYRARHLKLNRTIALKMLRSGVYAAPRELALFQREAEVVAELSHPNIVQVYDVGDIDGQPYFTMELVEGPSLAEALGGIPQPARRAAEIVAKLAEAIQVAHSSGIVHRDLKPANFLMTQHGAPKIADFGLARHFDSASDLTFTGSRIGTPSYMAPEQAAGSTTTVGPPADIYALGASLYDMLTGRPPFRGETVVETERQVISEEPVAPSRLNPKVPLDLEMICLKCLNKEPARRYASASELADDLHQFLEGKPVRALPVGWLERVGRWGKRNPNIAMAYSGVAALLALIVVVALCAAAYFHKLEGRQRQLAKEIGDLTEQFRTQGAELRAELYLKQTVLTGQAAIRPRGRNRMVERLTR